MAVWNSKHVLIDRMIHIQPSPTGHTAQVTRRIAFCAQLCQRNVAGLSRHPTASSLLWLAPVWSWTSPAGNPQLIHTVFSIHWRNVIKISGEICGVTNKTPGIAMLGKTPGCQPFVRQGLITTLTQVTAGAAGARVGPLTKWISS